MIEERRTGEKRYMFPCPRCGKKHYLDGAIFDDRVSCSCGFDFYAFAAGELSIIMPWKEANNETIARALRKLVVATGRCPDIPLELYSNNYTLQDKLLDNVLSATQIDKFGVCVITQEQLELICKSLLSGDDVELKWNRNHLMIYELKHRDIQSKDDESKPLKGQAAGSKELARRKRGAGLILSSRPVL